MTLLSGSFLGIPMVERFPQASQQALDELFARCASDLVCSVNFPRLAADWARLGSGMWSRAADSWYQRDRSATAALADRDEEMARLHASLMAELASGRMALPVAMEMTLVARFYGRLADHAVNIGWPGR